MDEEIGWESGACQFMTAQLLESRSSDCKERIVLMPRESGGSVSKAGGHKPKR